MKTNEGSMLFSNNQYYHAVQPIIHTETESVYGYEALLRSKEIKNPELLFKHYEEINLLFELDMNSIMEACINLNAVPTEDGALLFINVFPSTLINPAFEGQLHRLQTRMSIDPSSVVLEINEAEKEADLPEIKKVVRKLKKQGFLVALDDVGKGESSFRTLLELEPNIAKIDRSLAWNLAQDSKKQKLVQLMLQLFGDDVPVVLEGIESKEDFLTAKALEVPLVQGYYFGKPNLLKYYLETT